MSEAEGQVAIENQPVVENNNGELLEENKEVEEVKEKLENLDLEFFPREAAEKIMKEALSNGMFNDLIIFTKQGEVVQSLLDKSYPNEEITDLLTAFDDYDTTIGQGLVIDKKRYLIYRFFKDEGLIFGRHNGSIHPTGDGVLLYRVPGNSFLLATYSFPHLSARIAPYLQKLVKATLN